MLSFLQTPGLRKYCCWLVHSSDDWTGVRSSALVGSAASTALVVRWSSQQSRANIWSPLTSFPTPVIRKYFHLLTWEQCTKPEKSKKEKTLLIFFYCCIIFIPEPPNHHCFCIPCTQCYHIGLLHSLVKLTIFFTVCQKYYIVYSWPIGQTYKTFGIWFLNTLQWAPADRLDKDAGTHHYKLDTSPHSRLTAGVWAGWSGHIVGNHITQDSHVSLAPRALREGSQDFTIKEFLTYESTKYGLSTRRGVGAFSGLRMFVWTFVWSSSM